MAKRDIFGELVEGVAAMKSHREGKLMLRSYKVDAAPAAEDRFQASSETLNRGCVCSRAVFARKLCINQRTLEKWEQGTRNRTLRQQLSFSSCENIWIPSRGLEEVAAD